MGKEVRLFEDSRALFAPQKGHYFINSILSSYFSQNTQKSLLML